MPLLAQKLFVPVAYVEAGISSAVWAMPEEINRMVADSITFYCLTTSEIANENLRPSSVVGERIHFVSKYDDRYFAAQYRSTQVTCISDDQGLEFGEYFLVALKMRLTWMTSVDLLSFLLQRVRQRGACQRCLLHPQRTAP